MKQIMSCEQFARDLDLYLDSELNAVQRTAFIEHSRTCPECGERLETATRILTMCAELDEGLQMPLSGQAAWRNAIKTEAARRKSARLPAFVRGVSSVAAALLIIAGGTYAYQNMGSLSLGNQAVISNETPRVDRAKSVDSAMLDLAEYPSAQMSGGGIMLPDGGVDMDDAISAEVADVGIMPPDDTAGFDSTVSGAAIKLIRSASRSIETSAYDADYAAVKDLIEEYEGRVESESGYGSPMEAGDTYGRSMYLSARIPSIEVGQFLASLDAVGTITSRSGYSQEITQQYYDASARLTYQTELRQQLQDMVGQTQSVTELIEIKRELANVQADIDSLQTQIKGWDNQVAYSSVDISMSEVADKKAVQPIDSVTLMDRVKVGFAESINMLIDFAQDMLVFVAMFWPWLVLGLIVVIAVCASIRRKRRR